MGTELATRGQQHNPAKAFMMQLERYKPAILRAMPEFMLDGDEPFNKIKAQIAMAFKGNAKLTKCSIESLIFCCYKGAFLGVDFSGVSGQAYLIPRGNEAVFQLGYKGMGAILCRATGARRVTPYPVYAEDELFEYRAGNSPRIRHRPMYGREQPKGLMECAYAVVEWSDGTTFARVATGAYLTKIYNSIKYKNGPWTDHRAEMELKTAVRYLIKSLNLDPTTARVFATDVNVEAGEMNQQDEPEYQELFTDDGQRRQSELESALDES